jgi:hypothetical protein
MKLSTLHQTTKQALKAPQSWCVGSLMTSLYLDPTTPAPASETISRRFVRNQEAGS